MWWLLCSFTSWTKLLRIQLHAFLRVTYRQVGRSNRQKKRRDERRCNNPRRCHSALNSVVVRTICLSVCLYISIRRMPAGERPSYRLARVLFRLRRSLTHRSDESLMVQRRRPTNYTSLPRRHDDLAKVPYTDGPPTNSTVTWPDAHPADRGGTSYDSYQLRAAINSYLVRRLDYDGG